jgi:hypothetical protein
MFISTPNWRPPGSRATENPLREETIDCDTSAGAGASVPL